MSITTDLETTTRQANARTDAVRTHALRQVTDYTARAELAAANPDASTEAEHRDRAAYWACIARENGATETHIDLARAAGHSTTTA